MPPPIGDDKRIVAAHDQAVGRTLEWIENNAVETRLKDPATGQMVRVGGQKMVAATFHHDTSRISGSGLSLNGSKARPPSLNSIVTRSGSEASSISTAPPPCFTTLIASSSTASLT